MDAAGNTEKIRVDSTGDAWDTTTQGNALATASFQRLISRERPQTRLFLELMDHTCADQQCRTGKIHANQYAQGLREATCGSPVVTPIDPLLRGKGGLLAFSSVVLQMPIMEIPSTKPSDSYGGCASCRIYSRTLFGDGCSLVSSSMGRRGKTGKESLGGGCGSRLFARFVPYRVECAKGISSAKWAWQSSGWYDEPGPRLLIDAVHDLLYERTR